MFSSMKSRLILHSRIIALSMRVPFLVLTPVCVFLGMSVAVGEQPRIDWFMFGLVLIGALAAHISVNTLNEYLDFKSGLDLKTRPTPFSGGSGALKSYPEMANLVLGISIFFLLIVLMIGLVLVYKLGIVIAIIGFTGLLIIISYTQWINKHPVICLLAPGTGFGILMVAGTHYVLAGQFSVLSMFVALVPFFLVNNLLLLNQYPDIHADKSVGRNHFPIAYGIRQSNYTYGIFALLTVVALITTIVHARLTAISWLSLLPMTLALYVMYGAIRYQDNLGLYPKYMGANVVLVILTPLLLGLSILTRI